MTAAPNEIGLLLFVSEAERHVEILADRGIEERVDQAAWDKIVADFVASVAAGTVAPALTAAIGACATILETHYPATGGATGSGTVTEL